jgi:hypothetical protein
MFSQNIKTAATTTTEKKKKSQSKMNHGVY